MNVRIVFLWSVFTCSIFADQHPFHAHMRQREEQKEQLLPEKQSETLIQRINYIAIQTSPLWAPFLLSYLIDVARSLACEAVASKINPESKLHYAGFEFKTQNVARVGLELSSHALVLSVLQGKINERGSYTLDLSVDVVKQSLYNTILFAMPRYGIPSVCTYSGIPQYEGKVKWVWRTLTYCPLTYRVVQEIERARKIHEQSQRS